MTNQQEKHHILKKIIWPIWVTFLSDKIGPNGVSAFEKWIYFTEKYINHPTVNYHKKCEQICENMSEKTCQNVFRALTLYGAMDQAIIAMIEDAGHLQDKISFSEQECVEISQKKCKKLIADLSLRIELNISLHQTNINMKNLFSEVLQKINLKASELTHKTQLSYQQKQALLRSWNLGWNADSHAAIKSTSLNQLKNCYSQVLNVITTQLPKSYQNVLDICTEKLNISTHKCIKKDICSLTLTGLTIDDLTAKDLKDLYRYTQIQKIQHYLNSVDELLNSLSITTTQMNISLPLKHSINADKKQLSTVISHANDHYPYIQKCTYIKLKLQGMLHAIQTQTINLRAYQELAEYRKDLELIESSLVKQQLVTVARYDLCHIIRAAVIGNALKCELTQSSITINKHIALFLKQKKLIQTKSFDEEKWITNELKQSRVAGLSKCRFKKAEKHKLMQATYLQIQQLVYQEKEYTFMTYNVTEFRCIQDILNVLFMFKEYGLISYKRNKISVAYIDIALTFTDPDKIKSSPEFIESIYNNKFYCDYLAQRQYQQVIKLDPSILCKQLGYVATYQVLDKAITALKKLEKKYNLTLHISIIHTGRAVIQRHGFQFKAEQTQHAMEWVAECSNRFSENNIFENILITQLKKKLMNNKLKKFSRKEQQIMQEWIAISIEKYKQINQDGMLFNDFIIAAKNVEKSKEQSLAKKYQQLLTTYHALPPVSILVVLTQPYGVMCYGLGAALQHIEQRYGINKLIDWYHNWPLFTHIINTATIMLQKSSLLMLKTELKKNRRYKAFKTLLSDIEQDIDDATEYILHISGKESLLENEWHAYSLIAKQQHVLPFQCLLIQQCIEIKTKGHINKQQERWVQLCYEKITC
ncbi:hypothetical protein DID76_00150 [Candidatus Marinamargulisbacteria bacterium SCGC AG-414-C22]|nr:hypothetical protein DID76_00150 [Candidatus Marinamargulisbacteria bacterium SCGC AG-414-C22]